MSDRTPARAILTRLRIAGFKSFADAVTIDILPGLTGIVGPNGCGKSNVVEALRWAMGESAARSLRGGDMDDVIFAGTAARPSRNLAEVAITLEGALPAPFDSGAETLVRRAIERGAGSSFRVGGREMRARDVQTLFADLATGARSSAMVSQGRVATLIAARPEERRLVLEEAAGITGLHARRHEAELKLRAAEQNLGRAEDLRHQFGSARDSLAQQAIEAGRYRDIATALREAESALAAVQLARAAAAEAALRAQAAAAREALAEAGPRAEAAARLAEAAEAALPGARADARRLHAEAERRTHAQATLQEDFARAEAALAESRARMADLLEEQDALSAQEGQSAEASDRLAAEAALIEARLTALPAEIVVAEAALATAARMLEQADQAAGRCTGDAAAAAAELRDATALLDAARDRAARAEADLHAAETEQHALRETAALRDGLHEAATRLEEVQREADTARRQAEAARRQAEIAAQETAACRAVQQDAAVRRERVVAAIEVAERRVAVLRAERDRLQAACDAAAADRPAADRLAAARETANQADAALPDAQARARHADRVRLAAADAAAAASRAAAEGEAERAQIQARAAEAQSALDQALQEAAALDAALALAAAARVDPGALSDAARAEAEAETSLMGIEAARLRLLEADTVARAALDKARAGLAQARARADRIDAEAAGLRAVLGETIDQDGAVPLAASLDVPAGLEAAIAAALAHGLDASLDAAAPSYWRVLGEMPPPPLPDGAIPLGTLLRTPGSLRRALLWCGVLPEGADAIAAQTRLSPGQSLVNRQGALWRWDGLVLAAAASAGAARLAQRNRLRTLHTDSETAHADLGVAEGAESAATAKAETARRFAAEADAARAAAEHALAAARAHHRELSGRDTHAMTEHAGLAPARARANAAQSAAADAHAACCRRLTDLPPPARLAEAARTAAAAAAAAEHAATAANADWHRAQAQARAALLEADRLAAADATAAERLAGLTPMLDRLGADLASATDAAQAAHAELAAEPDEATLQDKVAALASAAREAAAQAAQEAARHAAVAAVADQTASDLAERRAGIERAEALLLATAPALARLAEARAEAWRGLHAAEARRAACPDADAIAAALTQARAALAAARAGETTAAARLAELHATRIRDQDRWDSLHREAAIWAGRRAEAAGRAAALRERHEAQSATLLRVEDAPRAVATRLHEARREAEIAAAAIAAAELTLAEAESEWRAAQQARFAADTALMAASNAIEDCAARYADAARALDAARARAAERIAQGEPLPDTTETSQAAEDRARRRAERLMRERDALGPVNLRAQIELDALDEKLRTAAQEAEELGTAIARLRGSIGNFNREGRERLAAIFTEVDRHFQALFTRMMGGGRAHLALVGSDDPLEAGLEIYAQPPGKKLAALSLLSGGEQALTALSLILAVARCNPAPVAVLDEVDAPLDDANVERFCALIEDVSREVETRFLVVTHHPLTMARMHRLYGVTMQERGVSRILSVDLERASAVRQAAE